MQSTEKIPAVVVSLRSSTERRIAMVDQLMAHGITFCWEEAVLGRELPHDELARYHATQLGSDGRRRTLTPGEIGCALSHLNIYRRIVEDELSGAIVLEDDAILLDGFRDTVEFFRREAHTLPRGIVAILGGMDGLKEKDAVLASFWAARRVAPGIHLRVAVDSWFWRTCSYYVDFEAARNLLEFNGGVRTIADDWNAFLRLGVIKRICFIDPWVTAHPVGAADRSLIADERGAKDTAKVGAKSQANDPPSWRLQIRRARRQLRRCVPASWLRPK